LNQPKNGPQQLNNPGSESFEDEGGVV